MVKVFVKKDIFHDTYNYVYFFKHETLLQIHWALYVLCKVNQVLHISRLLNSHTQTAPKHTHTCKGKQKGRQTSTCYYISHCWCVPSLRNHAAAYQICGNKNLSVWFTFIKKKTFWNICNSHSHNCGLLNNHFWAQVQTINVLCEAWQLESSMSVGGKCLRR